MAKDININPYVMLARHLDNSLLGAPFSDELLVLLKALFSPEEAGLAAVIPFKLAKAEELAPKAGMEPLELGERLANMARRGLLYERETEKGNYYSLLPLVPGMMETQFMTGEVSSEKKKLAALFNAYYEGGVGQAMTSHPTPYGRVIPVNRAVENKQEILPHEKADEVIRGQRHIALTTCYCRQEAELLGKGCGRPKDVCLIFGAFALYAEKKGFARLITQDEALGVVKKSEQAGLIHVVDNMAQGANFMCNCCGCCCMFLKAITKLHRPGAVAQAAYFAQVDQDACIACETCLDSCQVGAIRLTEGQTAEADPEKCLGCGICALNCPEDAISLLRRGDAKKPPADWPELASLMGPAKRLGQKACITPNGT